MTTGLISGIIVNTRELGVERCLPSRYIGREEVARPFVLYAIGMNADRCFARACPREELPSFAIGLLKDTVIPATGVEIVKKERFRRGFCCGTIF